MTFKKSDFTVGQKLYYVGRNNAKTHEEITISKIGNTWLTADFGLRLDIKSLQADGGDYTSPGRAYLSKEEYINEVLLSNHWRDFKQAVDVHNRVPKGMTIEKIKQAKAILGFK